MGGQGARHARDARPTRAPPIDAVDRRARRQGRRRLRAPPRRRRAARRSRVAREDGSGHGGAVCASMIFHNIELSKQARVHPQISAPPRPKNTISRGPPRTQGRARRNGTMRANGSANGATAVLQSASAHTAHARSRTVTYSTHTQRKHSAFEECTWHEHSSIDVDEHATQHLCLRVEKRTQSLQQCKMKRNTLAIAASVRVRVRVKIVRHVKSNAAAPLARHWIGAPAHVQGHGADANAAIEPLCPAMPHDDRVRRDASRV